MIAHRVQFWVSTRFGIGVVEEVDDGDNVVVVGGFDTAGAKASGLVCQVAVERFKA